MKAPARPSRLQIVARPLGAAFLVLAGCMAVCALVGVGYQLAGLARPGVDDHAVVSMGASAGIAAFVAGVLWRLGASVPATAMRRQEAALTVTAIWFGAGVIGGLPYVLDTGMTPIDAFFEAVSGFTTTGATIVTDIEGTLSYPVLLWRALTQWLGGMGIVVLFVAIFPNLGVAAKHMYRSEAPGHESGGLQPRITDTAITLWRIYVALTLMEIGLLVALGMGPFEAVCHALTTLADGGFSTRDASLAAFDSAAIDVVVSTFMLAGGVNFALYYATLVRPGLRAFVRSTEFRAYVGIVAVATVITTVGILPNHGYDPLESLRYAYFFVASTITSTGFVNDDYMAYASPVLALMIFMMLVGGSSGSTAGGMKVSRVVLLAKATWREVRLAIRPQIVHVVRMERVGVSDRVLLEIAAFFFAYMMVIAAGVVIVCFTDGVSLPTAFGAMVTTVGNSGPAPWYVGADNFAAWSSAAKVVFSVAMVMGRLELLTVLAVLHRDIWR